MQAAAGHLKEVLTSTTATSGIEPDVDLLAALRKGKPKSPMSCLADFYAALVACHELQLLEVAVSMLGRP